MKRKLRVFYILLALIIVFTGSYCFSEAAATVKIQTWALYDSSGHLTWYNSGSLYAGNWISGVSKWNAYKPGIIQQGTSSSSGVVTLSDVNINNSTNATTYLIGRSVKFNTYNMVNLSSAQRTRVACHECGHCLGLAHNTSADMMFKYTPLVDALSTNDKASYTYAYTAFVLGTGSKTDVTERKPIYQGLPLYFSESNYCIDVNNVDQLVGDADVVFVGTVYNIGETEYKDPSEVIDNEGNYSTFWVPYTNYEIHLDECLKGKEEDGVSIKLSRHGGISKDRRYYLLEEGDLFVNEGETYIFTAYYQEDGSLLSFGVNSAVPYDKTLYEEYLLSVLREANG